MYFFYNKSPINIFLNIEHHMNYAKSNDLYLGRRKPYHISDRGSGTHCSIRHIVLFQGLHCTFHETQNVAIGFVKASFQNLKVAFKNLQIACNQVTMRALNILVPDHGKIRIGYFGTMPVELLCMFIIFILGSHFIWTLYTILIWVGNVHIYVFLQNNSAAKD